MAGTNKNTSGVPLRLAVLGSTGSIGRSALDVVLAASTAAAPAASTATGFGLILAAGAAAAEAGSASAASTARDSGVRRMVFTDSRLRDVPCRGPLCRPRAAAMVGLAPEIGGRYPWSARRGMRAGR